jgi:hypothetical protein
MDTDTQPEATHRTEHISSAKPCLLLMLAVSALWGFSTGFLPDDSPILAFLETAAPILLLSCAVIWCHLDSCRHDVFLKRGFYVCLVLCFVVAFPYYVLKTRGLSGFITLGCSLLFVTACCISVVAGTMLGCAFAAGGSGI